jgi:hypothetical protein
LTQACCATPNTPAFQMIRFACLQSFGAISGRAQIWTRKVIDAYGFTPQTQKPPAPLASRLYSALCYST